MTEEDWHALLLVHPGSLQYVEGILVPKGHPVALWIEPDQRPLLVTDSCSRPAQAERIPFASYSPRRPIDQPWQETVRVLGSHITARGERIRIGVEKEHTPSVITDLLFKLFPKATVLDATSAIRRMRRCKDPDEVDVLRRLIVVAEAAYARAREILRPGLSEVEVYRELQSAMTAEAKGPVAVDGDYASGPRSLKEGGEPTLRRLEPGDLYVLDLFPSKWGYQADLCRTFAVSPVSAVQHKGWEIVSRALKLAEEGVHPGRRARDLYFEVQAFLDTEPLSRARFGITWDMEQVPADTSRPTWFRKATMFWKSAT